MSNYIRRTKNPETGMYESAHWIDDYFGRHHHGVSFPSIVGRVFRQEDHQWEFQDAPHEAINTSAAEPAKDAERLTSERKHERPI